MKNFLLYLFIAATIHLQAQLPNPKFEMRSIWVASLGIDWPTTRGTTTSAIAAQKNELITLLNQHKSYGINTIFLHVRPTCDAVYKSPYEPWSSYLTGTQGAAPSDPNYDPLTFAILEAHKRGMELHVWLNPYRAMLTGGSVSSLAANHIIKTKPEWIVKCSGTEYRFLNPGMPQVREYLVKVIMDIVRRYDIDGVHFDDYFYPYSSYGAFNDDSAFAKYKYNFTDRTLWRMNNVGLLLAMINDSINAVKPHIKFGISPSGNPSVNTGLYISPQDWLAGKYTDTLGILHSGTSYIDYINPQLYWTDFGGHLPTWSNATFLNGRHMYIGHAAYRFNESGWNKDECSKQITLSRAVSTSKGGVYFSSKSVTGNFANCADTMMRNFYSNASINHSMTWKAGSNSKPNPPQNVRFEFNASSNQYELKWDKPAPAGGGDTAMFYIVYRFTGAQGDYSKGSNICGTTGETYLNNAYGRFSTTNGVYYSVSAVNHFSGESDQNLTVIFDSTGKTPSTPVLVAPANGFSGLGTSATLQWRKSDKVSAYVVQISFDSSFSSSGVSYIYEVKDTTLLFNGIATNKSYFWRVKAANIAGHSTYSPVFKFRAGFPEPPTLLIPPHGTHDVPINITFKWAKQSSALSYRFQLSISGTFTPSSAIIADRITSDTSTTVTFLETYRIHYWRVKAINSLGESDWSTVFGFETGISTGVETDNTVPAQLALGQNYPNPFNPNTTIRYEIPPSSRAGASGVPVTLKIFDLLGTETTTLVNKEHTPGVYQVTFNAVNIPSGIYIYRLQAGERIISKKFALIK